MLTGKPSFRTLRGRPKNEPTTDRSLQGGDEIGFYDPSRRSLHISQLAVSRLVADLEAEIGFKLFARAGGNVTPTEEAQSLMEDVEFLFRGLKGVYSAAQDIRDLEKGQIRLAVLPNLSSRPRQK